MTDENYYWEELKNYQKNDTSYAYSDDKVSVCSQQSMSSTCCVKIEVTEKVLTRNLQVMKN